MRKFFIAAALPAVFLGAAIASPSFADEQARTAIAQAVHHAGIALPPAAPPRG